MRVIGLTGGIATGKSTVGRLIRSEFGVPVVDADAASRVVLEPGQPAYKGVVQAFGDSVLLKDGSIDRQALRGLITSDSIARKRLNDITHPAIRAHLSEALFQLAQKGHEVAIVEAALLVETGSWRLYQGLIVVSCSAQTQLARVMSRDSQTQAQAKSIIDTQLPMAAKEAVASIVIQNNGSFEDLKEATREAWATIINSE